MKKIFTSTILLICLFLNARAQQPVVWMIDGNGTSPSSSWAAINYDASSSVVDGVWNLYQPKQATTETAKNCFIQYNPGYTSGVSNSAITTDRTKLRYFIISLKNNTANTAATFYYRVNPTTAAPSGSYKAFPFTISANDTEFKQYIIDLNNISDWESYFTIMPLFRVDIPNVALPVYTAGNTPGLIASVDYLGFSSNVTLPVSLTDFSGKKDGAGIKLSWSTASERNNSHFEVLRSADGKAFEQIASIPGNGTSAESHNYSFIDENSSAGTNYYQLRQVDFDGTRSFSQVIAVKQNEKPVQLVVFSSGEQLQASVYSAHNQTGKIFISDMSGRKVFEKVCQLSAGQNNIQLNQLASGMYIATLVADEAVSTKFVK